MALFGGMAPHNVPQGLFGRRAVTLSGVYLGTRRSLHISGIMVWILRHRVSGDILGVPRVGGDLEAIHSCVLLLSCSNQFLGLDGETSHIYPTGRERQPLYVTVGLNRACWKWGVWWSVRKCCFDYSFCFPAWPKRPIRPSYFILFVVMVNRLFSPFCLPGDSW